MNDNPIENSGGKNIIVLGDVNVDMVIYLSRQPGEAIPANLSAPQLFGGGTAGNTAVALARLGERVAFIGAIGDDGYGRWERADLQNEGIDVRGLRTVDDAFTAMIMAIVEANGERHLILWPPEGAAHTRLQPEDIDAGMIAGAAWLHTSGIGLRSQPFGQATLHGMRLARQAGMPVSIDLNLRNECYGWDEDVRRLFLEAVDLCEVVLGGGEEEIVPLAGGGSIEDAARSLSTGGRTIVARLGEQGTLAVTPQGDLIHVPVNQTQIVDTTGAGDSFDGGFIAARLAGKSIDEAVRWGNAVAALKIARPGARGLPSREEVEALLRRG